MIPHFFKASKWGFCVWSGLLYSRELKWDLWAQSFLFHICSDFFSSLKNKAAISWAWFRNIIKAYFYSAISSFSFQIFAFIHSIGARMMPSVVGSSSEWVLLRLVIPSILSFDISTEFRQVDKECKKSWKLSLVHSTLLM